MNIFSGIFSKWKKTESSDDFKVVLKTDKKLSEEQKDAIITITKAIGGSRWIVIPVG